MKDFDKDRLIKLLNLSNSDADGEALTALRLANKLLKQADLTWQDVLTSKAYKTSEAEREYAKGYRAGFKKGSEKNNGVVQTYRQRPRSEPMVHDLRRLRQIIEEALNNWDRFNTQQKHYVENAVSFVRNNSCLPLRVYDHLLKMNRLTWDSPF